MKNRDASNDLISATPKTLMSLWLDNRSSCRSIGVIIADARAGKLPGVEMIESGSFRVTDEAAALAAMEDGNR